MQQALIELLSGQPELTVITSTNRLSRRLLHDYSQHQLSSGHAAWSTPDILSWSAWVQRQWHQDATGSPTNRVVLTSIQAMQLWQSIIRSDSDELINTQATAQKAYSARQLLIDHDLDLSDEAVRQWFVYDADASRWLEWHQRYNKRLDEQHWLDQPGLTRLLINTIVDHEQVLTRPVCWLGFDVLTPLQQRLKKVLQEKQLWLELPETEQRASSVSLLPVADPLQEIRHCAFWARDQFEQHWHEGDKPIGIIVPRLDRDRQQVERIFRQVFYPLDGLHTLGEQQFHTQGIRADSVFNISLGYSLKQEPLVKTVLNILGLCRRSFSYEDFSQVLRSPLIVGASDHQSGRSQLDRRLRQHASAEISLHGLLRMMSSEPAHEFQKLLQGLSDLKQAWNNQVSAQTWVDRFHQCLELFGISAAHIQTQSVYQYQVMQSLDEVWFEFSRLELVQGSMEFEQAVAMVTQMVSSRIFQAGAAEQPVQILGMLEAAGMQFSALWVMGMTEQNWPPPANPNPFIPLSIQRQQGMPHCTAQHEYSYASQQTKGLLNAADHLVSSYPLMDGDEEFVPSPLVNGFPRYEFVPPSSPVLQPPALEQLMDAKGPGIDKDTYHAGSYALKDQSQCPFRAFVVHRLQGQPPEEPQPGNDPRLRGQLVHKVMELLWQQWQNSDELGSLSSEQLQTMVANTIEQVMENYWIGGHRDYEVQRLNKLVMEWLQQELQRQPFAVRATEQKTTQQIEGLKLNLVIDRVDELADGSICVIDYKTGEASTGDWVGDRPDEPQLPLYVSSLLHKDLVNAVAYANIRAGECRYLGATSDQALIGIDEQALKDIRQIPLKKRTSSLKQYDSWDGMLDEWQHTLRQLAVDHSAGLASVDPKDPPSTCRYCEVLGVCRLFDWQEEEELQP